MYGTYESPFGKIIFEVESDRVVSMRFSDHSIIESDHPIVQFIKDELDQYFKHKKVSFNVRINFQKGTIFEKEVWNRLLEIPYGKTKSYQDIANEIGRPKAYRAVGQACKKNPVGIIVPCHRVIGKNGSMTGYSGKDFVDLKRKLIAFEKGE